MDQVYADDELVYDSRLDDYGLAGLKVTLALNKGGAAEIIMPPNHPAYNSFIGYKTVVTVYRDNVLLFRGRALYTTDDFYNRRTVTCEGERCFFRDGVHRPYLYQDDPAVIFAYIVDMYNAQVEEFKQFLAGTVTVTDPNNYIRLESEQAEPFSDTLDKLVERCGGYIVFTTNSDGKRVINWYESLGYSSNQVIEFGENLLNFSRTGENTDLATVIIPYGAADEETGERVTINSVNDDQDFIQDDDAVALRGVIAKAVYWDDVHEPSNLLAKAQQYLASSKMMISTLTLSAFDLSQLDKDIDSFQLGDTVRVRSEPHGVDDTFLLSEQTINLLDPAAGSVVLGKDLESLTGADAAGDKQLSNGMLRIQRNIKADYQLGIESAIQEATQTLSSLIQQASDSIMLEVSETYAKGEDVESLISSRITQLSDSITFEFDQLRATVDSNDSESREQFEEIHKYIRFDNGDIVLGESGNEITLRIENDRISFLDGGAEVAYFSNKQLVVTDANFLHSLQIGSFAFVPRENGNLSLVKVG